MNHYEVKQHLMSLLSGEKSIEDLQAIGTPEAQEAVTISARNFNDITMAARDIHTAMSSKFVAKVKSGRKAFMDLKRAGIPPGRAVWFLGKTFEFQIHWPWVHDSRPYLKVLTPVPLDYLGLMIPLDAIVQDFDAKQCQRIYDWVLTRARVS